LDESAAPGDHSEYRLGATTEGTALTVSAVHGNARSFDGSADRIRFDPWTEGTLLPDREALSVSLWFKADSTIGQRVLFDDPAKHDALGARINNGFLEVTCLRNGRKVTASTAFSDTTSWHNLVVVKDTDQLVVYLDGNDVATIADLETASASSLDAGIGSPFIGEIDEVRLYGRAISTDEISALQGAPALSPGHVWRGFYFARTANTGAAADEADYDGDGCINLFERAFSTNPTDSANWHLPSINWHLPSISLVEDAGDDFLAITYRRLRGGSPAGGADYGIGDLEYTVEYHSDITGPWDSGSVVPVGDPASLSDLTEEITVRLPTSVHAESTQFTRLKINVVP
jgi:hypothetical protein